MRDFGIRRPLLQHVAQINGGSAEVTLRHLVLRALYAGLRGHEEVTSGERQKYASPQAETGRLKEDVHRRVLAEKSCQRWRRGSEVSISRAICSRKMSVRLLALSHDSIAGGAVRKQSRIWRAAQRTHPIPKLRLQWFHKLSPANVVPVADEKSSAFAVLANQFAKLARRSAHDLIADHHRLLSPSNEALSPMSSEPCS